MCVCSWHWSRFLRRTLERSYWTPLWWRRTAGTKMLHEREFPVLRSTAAEIYRDENKQSPELASLSHGANVGRCAPRAVRLGTAVTAAAGRLYGVQHVTTTPTNSDDANRGESSETTRGWEPRGLCAARRSNSFNCTYARRQTIDRSDFLGSWRQTRNNNIEMFVIYKCRVHTSQWIV